MDNLLLLKTYMESIDDYKKLFSSAFSMKDLGGADMILRIKIVWSKTGISLIQSHCIKKFLRKFNYWKIRLVSRSFDANCRMKEKIV